MEMTKYGVSLQREYPHGRAYDNLFNAEHRDVMVETCGFTSAEDITIEDLFEAR